MDREATNRHINSLIHQSNNLCHRMTLVCQARFPSRKECLKIKTQIFELAEKVDELAKQARGD